MDRLLGNKLMSIDPENPESKCATEGMSIDSNNDKNNKKGKNKKLKCASDNIVNNQNIKVIDDNEQIIKKQKKKREKREIKERTRVIGMVMNTMDHMFDRMRKCQDPKVKYSLLANTLMLSIDILSSSTDLICDKLDQKIKEKLKLSIDNVHEDLNGLMSWINTRDTSCN